MNSLLAIFHNYDEGGEYLETWISFYFDSNNYYNPKNTGMELDGYPVANDESNTVFDIEYNKDDLATYKRLKENAEKSGWKIVENGKGF